MQDQTDKDTTIKRGSAEPPQQVHKPVTLAQNVVLTIKVLIIGALIFGAIVALLRLTA